MEEESIEDIINILNKSTSLYSKSVGPNILKEEEEKKQKENLQNKKQNSVLTQKQQLQQQSQINRYAQKESQQQSDRPDSLTDFCLNFLQNDVNQNENNYNNDSTNTNNNNNSKNPTFYNSSYNNNSSRQQSQHSNQVQQTTTATNPNKVRFLQFMAWDGQEVQNVNKKSGYYFTVINGNPSRVLKGIMESNGFSETNNNDWIIMWSCNTIKSEIYNCLMPYQKVNHFPKSIEITRKDLMNRNLSKMQIQYGLANFNFFPKSYILPAENHIFTDEAEKFKGQWYICKPSGSSQGKGIFITDNVQEIIQKQQQGSQYVISHYIMNPLLINNLKFDLRIYVVVTSIHPLRIFVYDEGLTRFATQEYNVLKGDQRNRFAHLTNYSINKNAQGFVKNSNANADSGGSKWSLTALKDFFKINNVNSDLMFERIDDLIVKTIISIENQITGAFEMHVPFRNNCFQLFGFDVLIDSNHKPWLLEVNLSPSLNGDSPLDLKIKGSLLADLFTLIGIVPLDQRYTTDTSYNYTSNTILKDKNYANILQNAANMKNGQFNKQQLSNLERYVIKESEDELKRSRNFKRVYPTHQSMKYKNWFEVDRPFNVLLRNHELTKNKAPPQPMTLQQMYQQNGNKGLNGGASVSGGNQNNYIQQNMNKTKDPQKQSLRNYNMTSNNNNSSNQQLQQQQPLKSYNRKSSLLNSGTKTLNQKYY